MYLMYIFVNTMHVHVIATNKKVINLHLQYASYPEINHKVKTISSEIHTKDIITISFYCSSNSEEIICFKPINNLVIQGHLNTNH